MQREYCNWDAMVMLARRAVSFPLHLMAKPSMAERLMNYDKFPIAFSYGTRDWQGSEMAEKVVKSSAFYESGES